MPEPIDLNVPAVTPDGEVERICVACDNAGPHPAAAVLGSKINDGAVENLPYRYFMCADCKSLNIADIPGDLGSLYDGGYYSFAARRKSGLKALAAGMRNKALVYGTGGLGAYLGRKRPYPELNALRPLVDGTIARLPKSAKILDLGCGSGFMLHEFKLAGFTNLTGADPFLPEETQEDGLRIIRAGAADIAETFDLIIMNHSFEHVVDPSTTLQEVRHLMHEASVLLIRVPLVGGGAWRHYGGNWGQLDAPRHLWLFSAEGMTRIAGRNGLTLVHTMWDSTEYQFIMSEVRKRGFSWHQPASAWSHDAPFMSAAQREKYRSAAEQLNAAGQGDQASFYLTLNS